MQGVTMRRGRVPAPVLAAALLGWLGIYLLYPGWAISLGAWRPASARRQEAGPWTGG
jgi:hypothetical protein